jgi:alkanesulfonate monooxygenase SsuD/methylene tetrahydromethanopterin reductase-like flavin-dependent oxidoreductase (luciferase family)
MFGATRKGKFFAFVKSNYLPANYSFDLRLSGLSVDLGVLKFGVFLPFYAFPKDQREPFNLIRNTVLECETLGYHSVWLDDHLMQDYWPILEPWTTLSALSSITSKIRLGTMVSCIMHRNPMLLAKMSASIDVVSNGRLEFGVGAGIGRTEHAAYGFDFFKPTVRIERLVESLEVIKRLWTHDKSNFQGKYYSLKDAVCEPKPVQKPYPPIIVGGSGEMLLRKATAPFADRLDFGFLPTIELYRKKLEILEKKCGMIGRSFGEIEKSCWPGGQVLIAETEGQLREKIAQKNVLALREEEFKQVNLAGTPAQIREKLQVYLDLGVSCFMLYFADLPRVEGLRLFAESVMDPIRGG